MQKRTIPALLAGVTLVLAACGGTGTSNESTSPGDDGSDGSGAPASGEQALRVDLGVEPPTLDPN